MKKFLILLIITISFISLLLFAESMFGADKVFIGGLISIPFLLVWSIRTDNRIQQNKNVLNDND